MAPISNIEELVDRAASCVRERLQSDALPIARTAAVLGSGLGNVATRVADADSQSLDYGDIPGFPVSTVTGHRGRLVFSTVEGTPVLLMQGRVHFYEGYSANEVVYPIRVLAALGVESLLLTNAAGGIDPSFRVGDLMLLTDHISLMPDRPAQSSESTKEPNLWSKAAPFAAESRFAHVPIYDKRMGSQLRSLAQELELTLHEGVYAGLPGPNYETPAEIRALELRGANAVGMSTVLEAATAAQLGIRVAGISCITNAASGLGDTPLNHSEVEEAARSIEDRFARLVLRSLVTFDS